ncbi:MAG TPA: hypothetical protein VHS59_12500 [Bacillota bacterium]|nr:hypothetical protein [Bacillota bacterium]
MTVSSTDKKLPLSQGFYIDGKPVCPGCRQRDKSVVIGYGMADPAVAAVTDDTPGQIALENFLGEDMPQGKFKFIARCERCRVRYYYFKDNI